MAGRCREANNNWRGGKTTEPRGYVLVRVGTEHHLADVRGYAYEHRVVAEKKLGRRLLPSEIVHHRDENPGNNHPDNLEVFASRADHFVEHRTPYSRYRLRMPGDENPSVGCECGCGENFAKFDAAGRPRRFVPGHNLRR